MASCEYCGDDEGVTWDDEAGFICQLCLVPLNIRREERADEADREAVARCREDY